MSTHRVAIVGSSGSASSYNKQVMVVNNNGQSRDLRITTLNCPGQVTATYIAEERRRDSIHLHLCVVLDVSGSMDQRADSSSDKTKLQVVTECIQKLCKSNFVHPDDQLEILTFTNTVQHDYTGSFKYFSGLYTNRSGATSARDGVLEGLRVMQKQPRAHLVNKEVVRYLLAFTDGADNSSRTPTHSLVSAISNHGLANFNLAVIAAGMGYTDLGQWQQITNFPFGKLITTTSSSTLDITAAFDQATEHLRHIIVTKKNGFSEMFTIQDTKARVEELDRRVAQGAAQFSSYLRPGTDVASALRMLTM